MSAGDKPALPSAARLVEEAISELHKAQRQLRDLQQEHFPTQLAVQPGDYRAVDFYRVWHALETIDDRIHDALAKLGD